MALIRTDFLRKKRDTDLGYVGRDPRTFGGGRAAAAARATPKRYTDAELLATGRTGAGRQAYFAQQRLNYPVPPPAQPTVRQGVSPSTPWQPERMQAIAERGRGVAGSQYERARGAGSAAPGGRTLRYGTPEGPAARYIGPGAPAGAIEQQRLGFLQARLAQAENVEALGRPSQAGALRGRVEALRSRLGGEAATLQAAGEAGRRTLAAGAGMAEAQTAGAQAQAGLAGTIAEAVRTNPALLGQMMGGQSPAQQGALLIEAAGMTDDPMMKQGLMVAGMLKQGMQPRWEELPEGTLAWLGRMWKSIFTDAPPPRQIAGWVPAASMVPPQGAGTNLPAMGGPQGGIPTQAPAPAQPLPRPVPAGTPAPTQPGAGQLPPAALSGQLIRRRATEQEALNAIQYVMPGYVEGTPLPPDVKQRVAEVLAGWGLSI